MEPIKEEKQCYDQMLIMEKYEKVISYVYPIAQSMPRKHGVAKKLFLKCLLKQPDLFFQAGKSNQVSKIFSKKLLIFQVNYQWAKDPLASRT